MLRLYLGVDRLPHHPVDITGADDAEVVLEPEDDLVTVFLKQGFVTHAVVLDVGDLERGERIGIRLAKLVLAGNHSARPAASRPSSATPRTPPRRRSAP